MKDTLAALRKKAVIGFVGGSDISKQYEQLGNSSEYYKREMDSIDQILKYHIVLEDFDFCFAENGLTAYRLGQQMTSQVSQ